MTESEPDLRLVADIGGTNARFAWQAGPGGVLRDIRALPCADHPSLEAATRAYLADLKDADDCTPRRPRRMAIGIANPVTGDRVQMTNHHWSFSIEQLRTHLGLDQLLVLNDFTALALAVPLLGSDELRQVGGHEPVPRAAKGVIGPGTGLGVSGLLPCGGHWAPLEGEGGHASLAPGDDLEVAVLGFLRARFGHVSAERAVSGPGLSLLHEAVCAIEGRPWSAPVPASDIAAAAIDGRDASCLTALCCFCGLLGSTAGNLALTLGARGGIYIGGGIVPRLGAWFDSSPFRSRFEAKGRFQGYLSTIPVYVMAGEPSPALRGAAQAFELHEPQA